MLGNSENADRTSRLPAVEITSRAARRLAGGYLWVFSNEIVPRDDLPQTACWCRFARAGSIIAVGYFNRHSLIAGRAMAYREPSDIQQLMIERLRQAVARRRMFGMNQAVRLVFSESDWLPGLVIDYFPPYAVIQSNTAGMDLMLPLLEKIAAEVLEEILKVTVEGLVVRGDSAIRRLEGIASFTRVAFGDRDAMARAQIQENGVWYAADLVTGQKTGFFLDQRDNRLQLGEWLRNMGGGRVLDLFCYSGGWGLRALHAGAHHVTFIDQSRDALRLVERGLYANGAPMEKATLLDEDVFEFLASDATSYDVVVVDPPAFVKSRKHLSKAIKAYQKLNRLAWRRLRPGGILFTSSCSYHLAEGDFLGLLAAAVEKEGGMAQIIHRGGQAKDHPVLLSMPETAYLKCVGLRKLADS